MKNKVIKAYKGFDKALKCRGFQYEVGKSYETDEVNICEKGFHACERPIDVFNYYAPATSRYCEVELSGEIAVKEDKTASTQIKIIKEISINNLVAAQIKYNKAHCTEENSDPKVASAGDYGAASAGHDGAASAGDYGAASAGDYGAASAGYYGAASAGHDGAASARYYGAASAGYNGAASAGYNGAASAGYNGAASAGDYGAASAGDYGAASAGYRGAASAGYNGAASSRGSAAVGDNGVAVARNATCKARGGKGAVLVLVRESKEDYNIRCWKAFEIDGDIYKENIWYTLNDEGEVVEADE